MKKFKRSVFCLLIVSSMFSCQKQELGPPITNSIGMEMMPIVPGSFLMGDQSGIGDWDEQPLHLVEISKPFLMSRTEITVEQYQAFRPGYQGSELYAPYATGISWYDARAFCQWLSEKEGKIYRLPSEAEWEYVCRAGTSTSFSSGDEPPDESYENKWGIKNMHTGPLEWCQDWYGDYPHTNQIDPCGRESGLVKVIRGGLPDNTAKEYKHSTGFYARSANRAGLPPQFSYFKNVNADEKNEPAPQDLTASQSGLVGIQYSDPDLRRQGKKLLIKVPDSQKMEWNTQNGWSARWIGYIEAPATGPVKFVAEVDNGIILKIDNTMVIDGWGMDKSRSGEYVMKEGEKYPIEISYFKDGGDAYMRLFWQWAGRDRAQIPAIKFSYDDRQVAQIEKELHVHESGKLTDFPIGFRIVQASSLSENFIPSGKTFVRSGIRKNEDLINSGPHPLKPYLRKRTLLPVPPDNSSREAIDASGLHPSFRGHNHSPALEVCPNGDVLLVIYTSYHEYEPGVSLMASRLRFGADQWDMPSPFVDFPDVNDHAPLLWCDNKTLFLFWGNPRLNSAYPFQWLVSENSGADFSPVHYPAFTNFVGPHSRQPINSAFRDISGMIYLASDGEGGSSVLWQSADNGQTWQDPGSRSAGRHTTYVLLKNGHILGMGGKNTNIDGFMPQAISKDKGKTWEVSKTIFPALASNQRPTIIRLKSGRLFFAADFQKRGGEQPAGINEKGAFVALSEDEARTWHIKKLPGTLPHESDEPWGNTIGYSVARQAPNGLIHLITTMNHPCLHFAMNEAWIMSEENDFISDETQINSPAIPIDKTKKYQENYPDGKPAVIYEGGIAGDGRFLLHGREIWYFPDGQIQYEATWHTGKKIGEEIYWEPTGQKKWQWTQSEDGRSVWKQWWPNGVIKSESYWQGMRCEGKASCWDYNGNLVSEMIFASGKPVLKK